MKKRDGDKRIGLVTVIPKLKEDSRIFERTMEISDTSSLVETFIVDNLYIMARTAHATTKRRSFRRSEVYESSVRYSGKEVLIRDLSGFKAPVESRISVMGQSDDVELRVEGVHLYGRYVGPPRIP